MCDNENYSCLVSWLIAIWFAFVIGFIFFLGLITDVIPGLIVTIISAFVIAIAFFVIILIQRFYNCIRQHSCGMVVGIIGTILFATIALSTTLDTNIISAILIGLVVFFLTYLIISFFKLLSCVIRLNENEENNNITLVNTQSISPINVDNSNTNLSKEFNSNLMDNSIPKYNYQETRWCRR